MHAVDVSGSMSGNTVRAITKFDRVMSFILIDLPCKHELQNSTEVRIKIVGLKFHHPLVECLKIEKMSKPDVLTKMYVRR
jgi:hypothetical protein